MRKPKYIRLDGKAQPEVYHNNDLSIQKGFYELMKGKDITIVSTGFMTHRALRVAEELHKEKINIGVIDIFMLKPINGELLYKTLSQYKNIITMEEAFINKGGLDSLIDSLLRKNNSSLELTKLGFGDQYVFEVGDREYLHKVNGLDIENIVNIVREQTMGVNK